MTVDQGLVDTSVLIAREAGRTLDESGTPAESLLSVVTLAELQAGVLAASDAFTKARRLATLEAVADIEVLPIDEQVALHWAGLRAHLAEVGRRVNVNDLWIAATALAYRLPVVTQDADFEPLDGIADLRIIRV